MYLPLSDIWVVFFNTLIIYIMLKKDFIYVKLFFTERYIFTF